MKAYPSGNPEQLLESLGVAARAKILDVGSGNNPFKYADVLLDQDFGPNNRHRDGGRMTQTRSGVICVQADITRLPFPDQYFDLVICRHVLEHLEKPEDACEELMRVAAKGFLETPRKWSEFFAGHPTHKWLIDAHNNEIVFEPVTYTDSPFYNFVLHTLWDSPELGHRMTQEFPHIPYVQLAWEGRFRYRIAQALPARVVTNDFLAESHYFFAKNLLKWMGGFEQGAFHAGLAAQMVPESDQYRRLADFYQVLNKGIARARVGRMGIRTIAGAMALRVFRKCQHWLLRRHRGIVDRL